jgi:phosphatidylserine/phosphatidylglycerophosphate/cardiolipin synthase-like enzyme
LAVRDNLPERVLMRRNQLPLTSFLLLLLLLSCRETGSPAGGAGTESLEVCFSPHGGCTETVVRELNGARSEVLIQAYSFTSAPIAKAIVEARKRGVKVEAVLDKSNRTDRYSAATFLKDQGCDVLIDATHAIAHNKIMIIDEKTIITGSFNFTKKAEESNAENLLIIRGNPKLTQKYLANFHEHEKHSEPYTGLEKNDADEGKPETRTPRPKPQGVAPKAK